MNYPSKLKVKSEKLKVKKAVFGGLFRSLPGYLIFFLSLFTIHFSLSTAASAQRDYLSDQEIEVIREAQEIDKRIAVLTQIIDRRFAALTIDVGASKIPIKGSDDWGAPPQGTRFEMLFDIKRILQKAIDDIDSIAERPDSAILPDKDEKRPKTYAELFPKAVHILAAAATRYRPALKAELDRAKTGAETGSILDSLDHCEQIIAAAAKLPAETSKKKTKNR